MEGGLMVETIGIAFVIFALLVLILGVTTQ